MKNYKPNLILSFLVLIVSFLSVLVINKQVFAAWYYPQDTPPNTSINNNFVFNPATENFNLGSYSLCLGGVCKDAWPAGGGGSDANWSINTASSNDLYYTTSSPASGEVGIGTTTPNRLLHLYQISGNNAEIDIQSTSGANNHWGIYQDRISKDLKFWQGNDRVTFADTGQVAVGGDIEATVGFLATTTNIIAIKAQSNGAIAGIGVEGRAKSYGVRGFGDFAGLYGEGSSYGIHGVSSSMTTTTGAGIYGQNSSGGLAGKFDGPVYLNGHTTMAPGKYLQITTGSGAPAVAHCNNNTGRLYYDYFNSSLYVCNVSTWRKIP